MIIVDHLDHLVLTVADINRSCVFYSQVLGMRVVPEQSRRALLFGSQKINLHQQGHELEPKAAHPTPGSGDLCFITATPLPVVVAHLKAYGIDIVAGPVKRSGARRPIESIYFRDPDGNLLEIANEEEGDSVAPQ